MDKNEAIKIAQEYVLLVSRYYNVNQAFLFGSFAKGNSNPDSDIDVAIVINNPVADIIDTQIELIKLRRKIDLRIEPHPFIYDDFKQSNPVVYEILKYGISVEKSA
jgi:predicted nucleotidyltransferase